MKKVLGLDIGVNSIGWAYIAEPENKNEKYNILGAGSRIIPLNSDETSEFKSGNAISKNSARRIKRGIRRGGHRYKMRKWKLTAKLKELGMFPDKELFSLHSLELYSLRTKAISEKISLQEIGRIFYHLNQKRGYKSNRKANNDENIEVNVSDKPGKKKGYLDLINDRENILTSQKITIGQYFYYKLKEQPFFRIKDNIFTRKSYQQEFKKIWDQQSIYYPNILTEEAFNILFNEIIYFQRPLKSQKHLVTDCRFEFVFAKNNKGELLKDDTGSLRKIKLKAAPKSSPLFQLAKVWQDINNLKIQDTYGNIIEITLEKKKLIADKLQETDKITLKELKKILGLSSKEEYYYNLKKEYIEGNRTFVQLKKILGDNPLLEFNVEINERSISDYNTGETEVRKVINSSIEQSPLYQLWHLLFAAEENENLISTLCKKYSLSPETALALSKLDMTKAGYGALSTKAYRKILPYLMEGSGYSDACQLAGYRHSDYLSKEENESRQLLAKLDLYPINSLRNPVVEKVINQVINLVNAILEDPAYGRPDEIRVELGRELKQNAEERNKTFSRNKKEDAKHKDIIHRLMTECNFKKVSRRDIERYKLWEEFGYVSPYEPSKPISLSELFSGAYEVEHIIPKSRLFDDSFANKTICPRPINAAKDNQTAFDYMSGLGQQKLDEFTDFIQKHKTKKDGISQTKAKYLLCKGSEIPQDFINRQMRETAYISREVKNLLLGICRNVHSTSGTVTNYLRHIWGLDSILQELNIEKYRACGQTVKEIIGSNGSTKENERIVNWSKRDDHRHHAIDAIVIALTKQSHIQKLNNLNQEFQNYRELKQSAYNFPLPWATVHSDVLRTVSNILVSFKSGKKVATKNINRIKKNGKVVKELPTLTPRGFLHKDKFYGKIKRYETVPLTPRFKEWDRIADNNIYNQLKERLSRYKDNTKLAFSENEKDPIPKSLQSITLFQEKFVIRQELNKDFNLARTENIIDERIKRIVKGRLSQNQGNPIKAFGDLENDPIWINKEKAIDIKAVRCFTDLKDLSSLHKNDKGENIHYVSTKNNHHIAIYEDQNGNLAFNAASFWDALNRKLHDLPVIIKDPKSLWNKVLEKGIDNQDVLSNLPPENCSFRTSLQQNEMFIFGMTREEIEDDIRNENYSRISKGLYRVQNISTGKGIDVFFRHHLETKLQDSNNDKEVGKFIRCRTLNSLSLIKVLINYTGSIYLYD